MKKFLYIVFVPFCLFAQTVEVEMILDSQGNRIIEKTLVEKRIAWLQMFANGRYKRFPQLATIEQDSVWAKKWDKKICLENFQLAENEFLQTLMFARLPDDEIENIKFYDKWPWGNQERKDFMVIILDIAQSKLDSIRSDSVSWRFALQILRDSLNIGNLTLRQINQNVNVPQKLKTWMQNNWLNLSGINLNTTIEQIWNDPRCDKRAFRFLLRRIKAQWLKRQLK